MNKQKSPHDELIAKYANCPSQLEAAIRGLSDGDLDQRKTDNDWTIREIIHHIVDGDDLWKTFVKQAIGSPKGAAFFNWYWDVPQDEWVKHWRYKERAIEPSLALFRANRAHIVQLLRHTPGVMEMGLRVSWPYREESEATIALLLKGQTQHVLDHVAEIGEIRELHGL
ncbi:MAG: DinB family protein [Chloroflexota bacterium]